jgi:cytochrome c peroxidase
MRTCVVGILAVLALTGAGLLWPGMTARADGLFFSTKPLPPVPVPGDNPQTEAKVLLGKQLYFDKRLSADGTVSCASCHDPKAGWADPRPVSEGVGGAKGGRNSPTVLNTAFNRVQFWDGRAPTLEAQAVGPIQNPVEMKMTLPACIACIEGIAGYAAQFRQVFGTGPTEETIGKAIAAFERTVISANSAFDRYMAGDRKAMSPSAVRGMVVFNGHGHCSACHSGPNFSDSNFHNLGIGMKAANPDVGRYAETKLAKDYGAFKTPTLRSIALTAPYLHDGQTKTLEEVVEIYDRGGEPNAHLDPLMVPLNLTRREKADLVEFLKALTGEDLGITAPPLPK